MSKLPDWVLSITLDIFYFYFALVSIWLWLYLSTLNLIGIESMNECPCIFEAVELCLTME